MIHKRQTQQSCHPTFPFYNALILRSLFDDWISHSLPSSHSFLAGSNNILLAGFISSKLVIVCHPRWRSICLRRLAASENGRRSHYILDIQSLPYNRRRRVRLVVCPISCASRGWRRTLSSRRWRQGQNDKNVERPEREQKGTSWYPTSRELSSNISPAHLSSFLIILSALTHPSLYIHIEADHGWPSCLLFRILQCAAASTFCRQSQLLSCCILNNHRLYHVLLIHTSR
jgi:hypothetical protein